MATEMKIRKTKAGKCIGTCPVKIRHGEKIIRIGSNACHQCSRDNSIRVGRPSVASGSIYCPLV